MSDPHAENKSNSSLKGNDCVSPASHLIEHSSTDLNCQSEDNPSVAVAVNNFICKNIRRREIKHESCPVQDADKIVTEVSCQTESYASKLATNAKNSIVHSIEIAKTETKLKLYHWEDVPHFLRDNEFIHTGYRAFLSYKGCFKSIFALHNETGNIWTHLLGAIFVLVLMITTFFTFPPQADIYDHLMFLAYLLCALECLLGSTMFHTLFCHSHEVYYKMACIDYVGISALVCGSFCLVTYYLFFCNFFWRSFYLTACVSLSVGGIAGPFFVSWHSPYFRVYRTVFYIALGFLSAWPGFHHVFQFGFPQNCNFWLYIIVVVGYVGGALIYAFRIPERYFPGKCDILIQSHQIWHVMVVLCCYVHYRASYSLMLSKLLPEGSCPIS